MSKSEFRAHVTSVTGQKYRKLPLIVSPVRVAADVLITSRGDVAIYQNTNGEFYRFRWTD